MPFQSEKQRRYMHANLPDIAKRWERDYANGGIAALNAQLNSLPEYYLPKNHGGLIPSHEAGIYGLAEGGTPMLVAKRNDGQRPGYGWDPGAGAPQATETSSSSSSNNGGGDRPEGMPAHLSYTAPTETTTTTVTDDSGDDDKAASYVNWNIEEKYTGGEDLEEQLEIDKRNALTKLKYDPNLTKREREGLEVGLGLRQPKQGFTVGKALNWIATGAAVIGTGGAALGLGGNKIVQTAQAINKVSKLTNAATTAYNFMNNTDFTKQELFAKIQNDAKIEIDKQQVEKDLITSLPKGHPERIALEAKLKVRTPPKHEGEGGDTTSIKIEDIETVNDAKAKQVQLEKYKEMERAAYLAQLEQQKLRAKQMAYWKQMMAPYMAARGGRIPPGYNTGGLSNLFRLKNV